MLKIHFGEMDNVYYGPGWFVNNYTQDWLEDELVGRMIKDVDKSEYAGGELINSSVLGPISPRDLSGGVKTLISVYNNPEFVFDVTSCGENCAKWLLEIGKIKDVLVNLQYPMQFKGCEPFEIFIENTGVVVKNEDDYILTALDLLHEE